MWKLVEFLYNTISEDLGRPVRLLCLIDGTDMRVQLIEPESVINDHGVIRWHEWGGRSPYNKSGAMLGWRYYAGGYSSFEIHRSEFESFGHCEVVDQWSCDIQDVTGLSSSKSNLDKFTSLDQLVETNSREMINEITEYKLYRNLAHGEIRILNQESTSDYFARYLWDDRIFLINGGGSHHFAAARYIANRIKRLVPLKGKLRIYSINTSAVDALLRDFDVFAISNDAVITQGFLKTMGSLRATFLWKHLPRPYEHARAIFLPKNEPRSMRVSRTLREAGVFDIGEHLTALTRRQTVN
ncbi:MAG: DUF6685 family protein [Methylobacter sp.]